MQEQLITFKTAKLAKEKDFNERVIHYYTPKGYCTESKGYRTERLVESNWNNGQGNYPTMPKDVSCSAPTQSLLQRWLREKHNILVEPSWEGTHEIYSINYRIIILGNTIYKDFRGCFDGQSYEEALEKGLQEALKLIKL